MAATTAFTVAGAAASAAVGAVIAGVAALLLSTWQPGRELALVPAVVASVAAAREAGAARIPLLQPKRQTCESWGKVRDRPVAAACWGFDIGLLFTTWFTYAGPWVVVALAAATRNVMAGAIVFVPYWAGRALPLWFSPVLLRGDANAVSLLVDIGRNRRALQLVHVSALLLAAVVLVAERSL